MKPYKKYLWIIKRNKENTAFRKYECTSLRDRLNQFWVQLTPNRIMEPPNKIEIMLVNQPFLPRFNKVTKDNVRTH